MIRPNPRAMRAFLLAFVVTVCLLTRIHVSAAEGDPRPDAYVAGYVAAILKEELGWDASTFSVWVRDGMAVVTADRPSSDLEKARARLEKVPGIRRIDVADGNVRIDPPPGLFQKFVERVLSVDKDLIYFPAGDVFRPLIADSKEPAFFVSLRHYSSTNIDGLVGAVGYGETFGLLRNPGNRPGDGFQVSIGGGLFAQFDLETGSHDLINADYTFGIPMTYRDGAFSGRLRLYHQSSHLGDEFLLRKRPVRQNLSFESMELLGAWDWRGVRFYGGGEFLLTRQPSSFDRHVVSGGIDYIGSRPVFHLGRPVFAVGIKSLEENHWNPGVNGVVGIQFGSTNTPERTMKLVLEAFTGNNPHGQFYRDDADYLGMGLYLGF